MNRIIITGPTGAIGMALIRRYIEEKMHVTAVVNPQSRRKEILKKEFSNNELFDVVEKDISNYSDLHFEAGYDVWIHLAWAGASGNGRNDVFLQNRNVTYMLEAIEAAHRAGCHTFVGAGSQAEYGYYNRPISEDSPTFPVTAYGIAKLCAGQMGNVLCRKLNINYVWPRIFSVYGPYDGDNTMIMKGIRSILNKEVPLFTKGEQEWDYLYSEDAAYMIYCLAENAAGNNDRYIYCLGSGSTKKISDFIDIMRKSIDINARVNLGGIPYSDNQLMYLCADISRVQRTIGPVAFTSFEEGIGKTIQWVADNY